jgi:hypothetical protein
VTDETAKQVFENLKEHFIQKVPQILQPTIDLPFEIPDEKIIAEGCNGIQQAIKEKLQNDESPSAVALLLVGNQHALQEAFKAKLLRQSRQPPNAGPINN